MNSAPGHLIHSGVGLAHFTNPWPISIDMEWRSGSGRKKSWPLYHRVCACKKSKHIWPNNVNDEDARWMCSEFSQFTLSFVCTTPSHVTLTEFAQTIRIHLSQLDIRLACNCSVYFLYVPAPYLLRLKKETKSKIFCHKSSFPNNWRLLVWYLKWILSINLTKHCC